MKRLHRLILGRKVRQWFLAFQSERRSELLDREIIEYYGGREAFDEWARNSYLANFGRNRHTPRP